MAGIHAREWIAPATALWTLHAVLESGMAEQLDWFIHPVVNPDGFQFTHEHVGALFSCLPDDDTLLPADPAVEEDPQLPLLPAGLQGCGRQQKLRSPLERSVGRVGRVDHIKNFACSRVGVKCAVKTKREAIFLQREGRLGISVLTRTAARKPFRSRRPRRFGTSSCGRPGG